MDEESYLCDAQSNIRAAVSRESTRGGKARGPRYARYGRRGMINGDSKARSRQREKNEDAVGEPHRDDWQGVVYRLKY